MKIKKILTMGLNLKELKLIIKSLQLLKKVETLFKIKISKKTNYSKLLSKLMIYRIRIMRQPKR